MAVGGVRSELVSTGQIPDTQGKYRQNSANRVLLAELVPRCSRAISNAERQIPFDQEQGIHFNEHGNPRTRNDHPTKARTSNALSTIGLAKRF
jgi:hypothetical protein